MRYTEMKYSGFSDIGEIPAHWPVVRIKHRYSVFCGATPSDNPENWNGHIAWIGPADMSDFGKIKNGKRTISQIGYESCGTHKLPKGSVILSTRAPIGKIQIAEEEVCTNQGCKSMVKRYDKDTSDYLAYFLFSIKERLEVSGTGTTFKELSTINLKNMPLLLPSSSEQATIAAYLDEKCAAIDEIIAQAKATIEEYKAWKASVIIEAVTKGLDPNAEMKDSGFPDIGEVPCHWLVVRLKHRYKVFCGATPSDNPENWNGGIAWIGPADMSDFGKIKNGKRTISQIGYESCGTHKLPKGSIILSTRAPIGKIQISEAEMCTNQGCKSMVKRYDDDISNYLAYYLFSTKERLELFGTGTTFKELSTVSLKNMPLLVPSSSEQSTIVDYLDRRCAKIDNIIVEKQMLIDELETYKKSLIFETVTGKRRVC